jgi:hypothetical protein
VKIIFSTKESDINATTVAVDLEKSVFQLVVADENRRVVETRRLTRIELERWFSNRGVSLVIMEAGGTAHQWRRSLSGLGIEVRLLPAQHVRAYAKRNKTGVPPSTRRRDVPPRSAQQTRRPDHQGQALAQWQPGLQLVMRVAALIHQQAHPQATLPGPAGRQLAAFWRRLCSCRVGVFSVWRIGRGKRGVAQGGRGGTHDAAFPLLAAWLGASCATPAVGARARFDIAIISIAISR